MHARAREITRAELREKVHGFWVGQLVGNFMGFPFENVYVEEPVPVWVDRYYTFKDARDGLRINDKDLRAYSPLLMHWMEGAFGDDDTDIPARDRPRLGRRRARAPAARRIALDRTGLFARIEKVRFMESPL